MAAVRRYWKTLLWIHALLLLAVGLVFSYELSHRAEAQTAAPAARTCLPPLPSLTATPAMVAVDPATPATDSLLYSQLSQLRAQLALTGRDLAALGCDQATAEKVLRTLREWHQAHQETYHQLEREQAASQRDLQEAYRQINVGPRNENLLRSLPTLHNRLQQATQQQQQYGETAAAVVGVTVPSASQPLWQAARTNAMAPARYRYVTGLTSEQASQLQKLQTPSSAGQAPMSEAALLTASQQATLQTTAQNLRLRLAEVARAEEAVLPLPLALRAVATTAPSPKR